MALQTASVLIVSEEILRNSEHDHITKFITKELNCLHYNIQKLTVLPTNLNVISQEIQIMSQHYDILLIIGDVKSGIVYEALGKTFSQDLQYNSELGNAIDRIEKGHTVSEASIPVAAKFASGNAYPLICLQRMFIINEQDVENTFNHIFKPYLVEYKQEPAYCKTFIVNVNGHRNNLEDTLNSTESTVKIEISKENQSLVVKGFSSAISHLVDFEEIISKYLEEYDFTVTEDSNICERIFNSTDLRIRNTLDNIETCLNEYGPANVFLSFNGGKDCTVLLHLILAVLRKHHPNYSGAVSCLYVQNKNPFPEQDEFITICQRYYKLEILTLQCGIKEALEQVLTKYPNFKACFMGTRRTDPFSKDLKTFQKTDPGWPEIMRVSPLLDWHYSDIWDFLLYYKIPYCKLYDLGYTSLGNTINTVQNPSLIYYNVLEGKKTYLPAHKLLVESNERNGRSNNS